RDGRFYRRTLRQDRGAAPPPQQAGTTGPAAPREPREEWQVLTAPPDFLASGGGLRTYQVIVLGRDTEVFLDDAVLARLREWLARDGGCLVCSRGQPAAQVSQRLAALLPVRWAPAREARFGINLTERGRDLGWFPPGAADEGG